MAKSDTSFFCSECGYEAQSWLGRCPSCGSWNCMVEARRVTGAKKTKAKKTSQAWIEAVATLDDKDPELLLLDEVSSVEGERLSSDMPELDTVLGGGFVKGSLVLVGGDPGIGKSTLLLQVCGAKALYSSVLYVSGEESPQQIKLRATRLGLMGKKIKLLPEINFEKISQTIIKTRPKLCVIDSIQTIYSEELGSAPGSVSQVRDVTAGLLRIAKKMNITIVLVGHVTKEGAIAGPRVLEHMVDTVLYFEGEGQGNLRIIRAVKNRFGATDELGMFEMTQEGLKAVANASEAMLAHRPTNVAGTAVTCSISGSRPIMVEVQALTSLSNYGQANRSFQGVERSRLLMILAVIEKKLQLPLSNQDIFINVIGGLQLKDMATDLALALAIISACQNKALSDQILALGEVGLTGELRSISAVERRIVEAYRMGFRTCILPSACAKRKLILPKGITPDIVYADNLAEVVDICWKQ